MLFLVFNMYVCMKIDLFVLSIFSRSIWTYAKYVFAGPLISTNMLRKLGNRAWYLTTIQEAWGWFSPKPYKFLPHCARIIVLSQSWAMGSSLFSFSLFVIREDRTSFWMNLEHSKIGSQTSYTSLKIRHWSSNIVQKKEENTPYVVLISVDSCV